MPLVPLILVSLWTMTHASGNTTYDLKTEVTAKVLKGYNKYILPGDEPFRVWINVGLGALGEIDEIEEKLSTVLYMEYLWIDERINWDYELYGNITYITLGWVNVWTPIFRVGNPHAEAVHKHSDSSAESVFFNHEGFGFFDEMITTKTTCDLDMTYFPFDIQTCHIKMYIIGNNKFDFTLEVEWDTGTVSESRNGAWNLVEKSYSVDDYLEMIDLKLSFQRRPLFLLLNIFLPIIVLALLTPIVFALPKHSGERVGYSITMLLAISVYMTIISDNLPQNSDPMPLVSIMMFIWYILDSAIVFIVIINTKIYNTREDKPVPLIACKFVQLTRKITCEKTDDETGTSEGKGECQSTESNPEECNSSRDRNGHPGHANVKWTNVSTAIDKWFFVISYSFKILIPIIFFTIAKIHSKPPEH